MKRTFVRAIWGDISENGIRKGKMRKDIDAIKANEYNEPFVVYVFGDKNAEIMRADGFDVEVIDGRPVVYDMETQLYRHKLDVLEYALRDYDEIVFLDWDCVPTAPLPDIFWDKMSEKAPFQANLFQYRTKKCLWRNSEWRKVCNGGFLYLRDRRIAQAFISNYEFLQKWVAEIKEKRESQGKKLRFRELAMIFDDEPAMTKWIDDTMGTWPGVDKYWELFEPDFCNVKTKSAFPDELLKEKQECFVHWG